MEAVERKHAAEMVTNLKLSSSACASRVETHGKQGQIAFATIQISGATTEEKRKNKKELTEKLKEIEGVKAFPVKTAY